MIYDYILGGLLFVVVIMLIVQAFRFRAEERRWELARAEVELAQALRQTDTSVVELERLQRRYALARHRSGA